VLSSSPRRTAMICVSDADSLPMSYWIYIAAMHTAGAPYRAIDETETLDREHDATVKFVVANGSPKTRQRHLPR
jgi:hypothetical protein